MAKYREYSITKEEWLARFQRPELRNVVFSPIALFKYMRAIGLEPYTNDPEAAEFILDAHRYVKGMPRPHYPADVDPNLRGGVVIIRVGTAEKFDIEVFTDADEISLTTSRAWLKNTAKLVDGGTEVPANLLTIE